MTAGGNKGNNDGGGRLAGDVAWAAIAGYGYTDNRFEGEDDHPRVYSANSTQAHRSGPSEVHYRFFRVQHLQAIPPSHITIDMTHFTDALSGIVRHFYIDPAAFLDNPIVSQLGWTSIATW